MSAMRLLLTMQSSIKNGLKRLLTFNRLAETKNGYALKMTLYGLSEKVFRLTLFISALILGFLLYIPIALWMIAYYYYLQLNQLMTLIISSINPDEEE